MHEAVRRLERLPFGWHRVAAIGFLVRLIVAVAMIVRIDVGLPIILFTVALHLALAIGCWIRNTVALAFGLYAAFMGVVLPVVLAGIAWPQPWLAINVVLSGFLLVATLLAWRTRDSVPA